MTPRIAFKARFAALAAATCLAGIATPAAAQGSCTRDQLQDMADSWISAVERGTMMTMELGEWVDYNENFARGSLGGFLDHPREVDWSLALLDTAQCKVFVEAVMLDEQRPLVTAMQFGRGFFGVGPFDHIVTDAGDWLFDANATYEYARRENWDVIPEGQRNTREELIAAADAYLDLFNDATVAVPWGEPCARLEGGAYTGRGLPTDTCNVGVPEGVELKNRRYVVDEARGAVNVFLEFGADARPDSHTFRVENGRLRYIHTVTYCEEDNCGFDPFDQMLASNPDMQPPYAD
ncbi:hypothetical protein GRI62_06235 [Erythrobacter arachoides]|uniref:DUF8021 domain-containing protein n=1 Tax=Aurantiacibacter arachoides TaxID=1850444 RepID=A0A845A0F9_9SPHN|nr:hypothetical protein [Aurantiacibacter arachoides]MXO93204.1 hypothetical protein [Aurantiacibacter arachoides]GGD51204.1 hypothetical protein GCM10011411_08790 [Aurantiacibacter arachoides]